MKDITELDSHDDIIQWCRDFFFTTDELCPGEANLHGLYRSERLFLMALVSFLRDWCQPKYCSLSGLLTLLSMAEIYGDKPNYISPLDMLFIQIETGDLLSADDSRKPSKFRRRDGVRPADCGGLSPDDDFTLQCWHSLQYLSRADLALMVSDLTCRAIDFKSRQSSTLNEIDEDIKQTQAGEKKHGLARFFSSLSASRKEQA